MASVRDILIIQSLNELSSEDKIVPAFTRHLYSTCIGTHDVTRDVRSTGCDTRPAHLFLT